MEKEIFNKQKTYHLVPDNGDWKIVEEIVRFVPLKEGKNKSELLKEVVGLARQHKPSRVVIYKSTGDFQEDRNYSGNSLPPLNSVATIVRRLKALTKGLYYPSESDYPFQIFTRPGHINLMDELFKISTKPSDSLTEKVPFQNFFERLIPADWMDEEQQKNARLFLKLKQYLEVVLKDLAVFRIGKIEIAVLITGKTSDDNFVILKSTSIET